MKRVALLSLVAASLLLSGCAKEEVEEVVLTCLLAEQEQASVTRTYTQCVRWEGEDCAVAVQVRILQNPEIAVDAVSARLQSIPVMSTLAVLYQQFFTPATRRR